MKRVGLMQAFHGEPDAMMEGLLVEGEGKDQITLDVKGGTLTFIAPANVPDSELLDTRWLQPFLLCELVLEQDTRLRLWVVEGAFGVEYRMEKQSKAASSPEGSTVADCLPAATAQDDQR